MKVGDYIRIDGYISKIGHTKTSSSGKTYAQWKQPNGLLASANINIIEKSSPNIIDLIEENDLIKIEYEISGNEKQQEIVQVIRNFQGLLYVNTFVGKFFIQDLEHYNRKMLSIVTKEQFSQMEYKLGE